MKECHEITRASPIDGVSRTTVMFFDMEDYKAWESGRKLIHQAFPYLTPGEREFLMTGITVEAWGNLFKESDE